nr:HAD-IA family hydrolase [uncultured Cohaesibacter sp.]
MLNWTRRHDFISLACQAIDDPDITVVSFDIFDTLLTRPVLEPSDLFYLIEKQVKSKGLLDDFVIVRKTAEKDARQQMRKDDPLCEEPSLDQIYDCLQVNTGISKVVSEAIKDIEIETEAQCLQCRWAMKDVYAHARAKNKRIVAVSDSYFSKDFLIKITTEAGFVEFEHFFVSSEYKRTKSSKNLYPLMLEDLGVSPQQILHIGDNLKSDFNNARKAGMKALRIPSAAYLFFTQSVKITPWLMEKTSMSPDYRAMLGMVINNRFDGLQQKKWQANSAFNNDAELFGYLVAGPLLYMGQLGESLLRKESPTNQSEQPDISQSFSRENNPQTNIKIQRGAKSCLRDMQTLFPTKLDLDPQLLYTFMGYAISHGTRKERKIVKEFVASNSLTDHLDEAFSSYFLLYRWCELTVLQPFVNANQYLRLIYAAPIFFEQNEHPMLKPFKMFRAILNRLHLR